MHLCSHLAFFLTLNLTRLALILSPTLLLSYPCHHCYVLGHLAIIKHYKMGYFTWQPTLYLNSQVTSITRLLTYIHKFTLSARIFFIISQVHYLHIPGTEET
jgi:hypothetical protein